jgi:hypothetical protein
MSPNPRIIPLVSDTESQPTPVMRVAIANAVVGDEQRVKTPPLTGCKAA